MYTAYNIKARLAALGKTAVDVIRELKEYGVKTDSSEFSKAINRNGEFPKYELICDTADKIISGWEGKV